MSSKCCFPNVAFIRSKWTQVFKKMMLKQFITEFISKNMAIFVEPC